MIIFHSQISLTGSVVLLGWCFIVDVSSQEITLVSSLQATNRTYVCPDEIATYVCRGGGNAIDLFATLFISSNNPISYVLGDVLGTEFVTGPILTNLTSTADSIMIANIIVQNSTLQQFSIITMQYAHLSKKLKPCTDFQVTVLTRYL